MVIKLSELPDEIYAKSHGQNTINQHIIDTYGANILKKMKKSKVYCKYCKERKPAWSFSNHTVYRHNIICFNKALEDEKQAITEGWLTVGDEITKTKKVCYNCKHYGRIRQFCFYQNTFKDKVAAKRYSCKKWSWKTST